MSYHNEDKNYSLEDFTKVLNKGFETDNFSSKMGFEEIKHLIIKQHSK